MKLRGRLDDLHKDIGVSLSFVCPPSDVISLSMPPYPEALCVLRKDS